MSKDHLPFIHPNGTSRNVLIDERLLVKRKLEEAKELLQQSAPNLRDYYLEHGRFEKANQIYLDRLNIIDTMILDIYNEAIAISKL